LHYCLTLAGRQVYTKTGSYKGKIVAVKDIKRKRVVLDRTLLMELEEVSIFQQFMILQAVA